MIKRAIALLGALLLAAALLACGGGDTPETTAEPAKTEKKTTRVYVYKSSFDGLLEGKSGYEVEDEKLRNAEDKILDFAGQKFTLAPNDREVTRVFSGDYEITDTGVEKMGTVLRCYESYKYEGGDRTVRAGYTKGGAPVFVEMSGKDLLYLEKSEKELTDLARLWLAQTFRMDVTDMTFSMISVMPTETLNGYMEGADTYLLSFTEKIGIFDGRSATVTMSSDRVVLLVRNYDASAYEEKLRALDEDALYGAVTKALSEKLPSYRNMKITGLETPIFDVVDGFAYIEFRAKAVYLKKNVEKSEELTGIVDLDSLTWASGA